MFSFNLQTHVTPNKHCTMNMEFLMVQVKNSNLNVIFETLMSDRISLYR